MPVISADLANSTKPCAEHKALRKSKIEPPIYPVPPNAPMQIKEEESD
jgi:hypothetical protein